MNNYLVCYEYIGVVRSKFPPPDAPIWFFIDHYPAHFFHEVDRGMLRPKYGAFGVVSENEEKAEKVGRELIAEYGQEYGWRFCGVLSAEDIPVEEFAMDVT